MSAADATLANSNTFAQGGRAVGRGRERVVAALHCRRIRKPLDGQGILLTYGS